MDIETQDWTLGEEDGEWRDLRIHRHESGYGKYSYRFVPRMGDRNSDLDRALAKGLVAELFSSWL